MGLIPLRRTELNLSFLCPGRKSLPHSYWLKGFCFQDCNSNSPPLIQWITPCRNTTLISVWNSSILKCLCPHYYSDSPIWSIFKDLFGDWEVNKDLFIHNVINLQINQKGFLKRNFARGINRQIKQNCYLLKPYWRYQTPASRVQRKFYPFQ